VNKTEANHLPSKRNAPRRSGRRGIGPVDEAEKRVEEAIAKGPKQKQFAGMEDERIEELESAAEFYAELRDKRQALTAQEVPAKKRLLDFMHANHKTHYKHGEIEIEVITKKESVRVTIGKAKGNVIKIEDDEDEEEE